MAKVVTEWTALRRAEASASTQRFWCEGSAEIARLGLEAIELLQEFRPLVFEDVQDDLEITLNLLTGTTRAAILVLESNLHLWPEPVLRKEYEPVLAELKAGLTG